MLVAKNEILSFEKYVWIGQATQAEKMVQELQNLKREKATKYHEKL